jgi:hypothetical protein
MEIQKKAVVLFVIVIIGYVLINDALRAPYFKHFMLDRLNKTLGNYSNHTIVDWIENQTNSLAEFLSLSSVAIMSSLPVGLFLFIQSIILIILILRTISGILRR